MFNASKLTDRTNRVSYSLLDENRKVLYSINRVACFATLTYKSFEQVEESLTNGVKIRYIDFYFRDDSTPYDSAFIEKYSQVCTEMGFPFTYEGFNGTNHHILLDIESFNDKRIMLVSTLTIARYLLEDGLNVYPAVMFKLINEGEEPFIALQKAHNHSECEAIDSACRYGRNSNHAIKSTASYLKYEDAHCFSVEEFKEKVKNHTVSIRTQSSVNLSNFWDKGCKKDDRYYKFY